MLGKADLMAAIAPVRRGLTATAEERLLYTTSRELLNIDRFPLATLGQIYQCIRLAENRIYNLAEVQGPPLLSGLVTVAARLEPVSNRRVNVRFDRGVFGLQGALGYRSPAQFIQTLQTTGKLSLLKGLDFAITADRPPGWLEITYLDQDLRIGRGNQGSLFVLQKG